MVRLATFPTSTATLVPGDLVLLVTDGIIEATSPEGEMFGMKRTLDVVRQHQQQTAEQIVAALFDEVTRYCKSNEGDDMTAVILKADDSD